MPRTEDLALVSGSGSFTDDINMDGQLHMAVLRAPIAHGTLESLDVSMALTMPGVQTILTHHELAKLNIQPMNSRASVTSTDGTAMKEPDRPVLVSNHMVHLGQAIAAVFATTLNQALDALEQISLEFNSLPAITDPQTAAHLDSIQIWPDIPGNLALSWEKGNASECKNQFDRATHVVKLTVKHPRIAISPIEPRALLASYSAQDNQYTLHTPSQGVISLQRALAGVLNIDLAQLRVVTSDTGGSFAVKIWPYPEHVLALVGSKLLNRPVKWCSTRSEAFLTDIMGRGRVDHAQLALDANGKFLAFTIQAQADMGAFLNAVSPYVVTSGAVRPFGQAYDIPALHYQVDAHYTNCIPTDAYRGAGKPESAATLERLIDLAARKLGIDQLELRRRNLISKEQLPYLTAMDETYDGGDFPALATAIEEKGQWQTIQQRQAQSLQNGLLRGASLAFYLHATGGSTDERSEVSILENGNILVRTGLQDNGQGHRTTLAKVVAEAMSIPHEHIIVQQGDTQWLKKGGGTGGSNLVPVAANTVHRAALQLIENGRQIAAQQFETAVLDIEYNAGKFTIAGTDKNLSLAGIAQAVAQASAETRAQMPEDGCVSAVEFEGTHTTFPNGACICEVEVDPETGHTQLVSFKSIDDAGRVFDNLSAHGQLHGGIAQALGEALLEQAHYDQHGQLLAGSLMDYALPRAIDIPALQTEFRPTDSPNSLLGAKGIGELTSIGVPGPIVNAVFDALADTNAQSIDMPLTPFRIWQFCKNAMPTTNL